MKKTNRPTSWLLGVLLGVVGLSGLAQAASICSEVEIEIQQELTVERQAFDAMMKISNGFETLPLSNVTIQVKFLNETGGVVVASSNPQHPTAAFYIRESSKTGITALSNGVIQAKSAAEIHWLIIPAPGAGGTNAAGKLYYVGATLAYHLSGKPETVDVMPDRITVRPMPKLALDYYLPDWVYGDDPWTLPVEELVPFSLGLRVQNSGAGAAQKLKLESSQPVITENRNGLLVGFELLGCEVQGLPQDNTLLANFGNVAGGGAKVARWAMTASLIGRFTNFTARFTHADELGGELTSLIVTTKTHTLVRDVLVDLPGRDAVKDFMIQAGAGVAVHESDRLGTLSVLNYSSVAALAQQGASGDTYLYRLLVPPTNLPFHLDLVFPEGADKDVVQALRQDGKMLPAPNVWISKNRENGEHPWEYHFHLFDVNGGGEYAVTFSRQAVPENAPPVLAHLGSKVTFEGEEIGFLVQASDPNGTIPALSATGMPVGATFANGGAGTGTFLWRTQTGDYGVHPVRFMALDGQYTAAKIGRIYVGYPGEPLAANGLPESLANWKPAIKELAAMTGNSAAEVKWESVAGVPYEIYWSDQPFGPGMDWTKAGREVSAGPETEALDSTLGQDRLRRFYQVVVEGDVPNSNQVWGVIRKDVAPGYTLVSPPLRMDRSFAGELGTALAEALQGHNGGIGAGGDEVYILQDNGNWRMLYLDAAGIWREANGTPSTYELPAGQGLWIARKTGAAARLTFTGPVGNDGTGVVELQPGFNLIGLSEGKDLPLAQALAPAVPQGGAAEEEADQLVLQKANGSWRRLMYVQGWGAPFDGKWFDLGTFQIVPTNEVLEPGAAYYYLRRGQPTAVEF